LLPDKFTRQDMKTTCLLLILVFHSVLSEAQHIFQKIHHVDSMHISITNIANAPGNGFLLAGSISPYQLIGSGPADIFLMRTDSAGTVIWTRQIELANDEKVFSVYRTADSCYIAVGFTFGSTTNSRDGFMVKVNDSGTLQWARRIDHNGASNTFHSIRPKETGGFIVSGRSGGGAGGSYDMFLSVTDSAGNPVWAKTYGGSNWDWAWWADQTDDGGYIVTGETQSFGLGSNDIYVVKTDNTGNKTWSRVIGGSSFEKGLWVKQASNGYVVAGYTQGFVPTNTDAMAFLLKLDLSGNVAWFKIYEEMDQPSGVFQTPDGGYLLAGSSFNLPGAGYGSTDAYIIKTDSAGTVQWSRNYGGSGSDGATSFLAAPDGGFLVAGTTRSFVSTLLNKAYLIKTSNIGYSGCNDVMYNTTTHVATPTVITPVDTEAGSFTVYAPGITVFQPSVVSTLLCWGSVATHSASSTGMMDSDFKAYPNPTAGTIRLNIPAGYAGSHELAIFDMLGKLVYTARLDDLSASVDISGLIQGIYFCSLGSGLTRLHTKISVTKNE
jgi:hypothetical protein